MTDRLPHQLIVEIARQAGVRKHYHPHVTASLLYCTDIEDAMRSIEQLRITRPEWFRAEVTDVRL